MADTDLPEKRRKRLDEFVSMFRVRPGSRVNLAKDFDPAFKADVSRKKDGVALDYWWKRSRTSKAGRVQVAH